MDNQSTSQFQLISPAFDEGQAIPAQYTCRGKNVSPPLVINGAPAGTKSLALILHDPDAVRGPDFLHWLMWDIGPKTEAINASSVPVGAVQGLNDGGQPGYMGPCPPPGSGGHRYMFELYALDTTLSLPPEETSREQLEAAMAGHQLAHHRLTGLFKAEDAR